MEGDRYTRPFSWQASSPSSPIDFQSVPWPTSTLATNDGSAPRRTQTAPHAQDVPPENHIGETPRLDNNYDRRDHHVVNSVHLPSIAERSQPARQSTGEIQIKLDTGGPASAKDQSPGPQRPPRKRRHQSEGGSVTLTPRSENFLRSKYHVSSDEMNGARSARSSLIPTPSPSKTPNVLETPRLGNASPGIRPNVRSPAERLPRLTSPPPPPPPPKDAPSVTSPSSILAASGNLLTRMGTKAAGRIKKQSKYQKLEDERAAEPEISLKNLPKSRSSFDPADIPLNFDISSFDGPGLGFSPIAREEASAPDPNHSDEHNEHPDDEHNDNDVLEAKGQLTGGLGEGINRLKSTKLAVPEATPTTPMPTTHRAPSLGGWIRRKSSANPQSKRPGQQQAEKTGQVVAVEEEDINVDLSNVEGRPGIQNATTDLNLIVDRANKQSYYFPPDPQMPNWRPFPMSNWYIIILISIALALAGVQEYLVQLSRQLETEGKSLLTFVSSNEVSAGDWFVWKYLPEMILVTYGVMFQATDFEVRRLEPYYQMSKPSGAIASESLNMDYLTFWAYLIPFKALAHRQWAVVCSSISTILSSALIPVLFSAALNMDPDRDKRRADEPKFVRMDPAWSRVMEAALIIVAISGILLLWSLRRKSGLVSDPKGIAGLSVMATKSHILNDFRGLDCASHTTIHRKLQHRRYILHKSSLWQGEYISQSNIVEMDAPKPRNPHPLALHLKVGIVYIILLLAITGFIPVVEFTAANKLTSILPWFLTLLSTLIKLAWTNLETAIRMTEPFYVLSKRHASPRILLLDYTGTVPGYMPFKAAYNGNYLLACVGICSILCEVLTVCVSSFNVDGRQFLSPSEERNAHGTSETSKSYWISVALALFIPATLSIVLVAVYMLRRHAFLPRQPCTIASTLAFVAQSRMLYDFVVPDVGNPCTTKDIAYQGGGGMHTGFGTPRSMSGNATPTKGALTRISRSPAIGSLRGETRRARTYVKNEQEVAVRTVRRLEAQGRTYGLGWYKGRDGVDHLGIDEEELLADYKHGYDWSKGRVGLGEVGTWERY